MTADLVERVFGISCRIISDPVTATPLIIPIGRMNRNGLSTDTGEFRDEALALA